jgi:hypothetical protein
VASGTRCPEAMQNDGRSVTSEPTRELAQRLAGSVAVLLLWHPDIDSVELVLEDRATGAGCEVEIAPQDALDAFYHPYAYVSECAVDREDQWTINDG